MNDGWYDVAGDLIPGSVSVSNDTGRPERVFTEEQWAKLQAALQADPPE